MSQRTGDGAKNTILHVVAMQKGAKAMAYLRVNCPLVRSLINAQNSNGDTPLHVAARNQNVGVLQELLQVQGVNCKVRNNNSQKPAETTSSDKFGFDRYGTEHAISEVLRNAEMGLPTGSVSLELTALKEESTKNSVASLPSNSSCTGASSESSPQAAQDPDPRGSKHSVPLRHMNKTEEEAFMKSIGGKKVRRSSNIMTQNTDISSFMLTAGLGALSKAFVPTIHEDEEMNLEGPCVSETMEDFEEIKPLGEGAFGKVLLVKQKKTGQMYAMKLMDKAKFEAQKITSKAHSEQYILKTTRHPFIVCLHYAFQGSGYWVLVMDFCPNGDLHDYLVTHGSPSLVIQDAARLSGQILLAMEHLHSIQVIFRDLKLENVVLDKDNNAKVTDFGLAKKLAPSDTAANTMCGSYGYYAPEIMAGKYTFSVDLYSFGVLLYMLVSGGDPSPRKPRQRLPPKNHSGLRRRLREAEKHLSAEWTLPGANIMQLLKDLTDDDPLKRQTATEIKQRKFYQQHLGKPVDDLYKDISEETLPLWARPSANNWTLS